MTHLAPSMAEPPLNRGAAIVKPEIEPYSLLTMWRALRKHWMVATVVAVFVFLAVAFYTLGQTKIYRAGATIQLDPSAPRPLGKDVQTVVDMGAGDYLAIHQYLETQYKIIQSKRVAVAVVEKLGLHRDPAFLLNVMPRSDLHVAPVTPEIAAGILRERLSVDPMKESRLAVVRYEDANPAQAQRILSTLIDTYIAQNLDDTLSSVKSASDWLRDQLDKLQKDLEKSESAIHEFKLQKNLLALEVDDESNILKEELRQLTSALTMVRAKREELAAKRAELMKVPANDPRKLLAPELLQSPLLPTLRQRYEDAVRERDEHLGQNKGKNHVDVRRAEAAVAASRDAVLAEVRNVQGAADHELAVVQKQEGGLLALLSEAQRRAVEVNRLEMEYSRLRRAKDNNDKLYATVLERNKETDLQYLLRFNNIHVVDHPDVPRAPIRPRVPLMILFALLAGMASGLGLAVGLVALDRTIKTPEEVEGELGVTCLGLLPTLAGRSVKAGYYGYGRRRRSGHSTVPDKVTPELVVDEAPLSNVAEAARAVRTNLMFMSPDDPIRTLLVTSAGPSEGKTTVACCIAIAIAHAGHRTLLVDCDLRKPRVHRVFHAPANVGVSTAVIDEKALDGAIVQTKIPNLSILPAGPMPPNPADLMHSARFRALISELRDKFDRVVIDSSPIAPVTDATILSAYVDATMIVVRAFTTKKEMARHALRALVDIGSKTAGIVLNAVDFSRHEYKYSTHYGRYGYGTPYGESESDKKPRESQDPKEPPRDQPAVSP